MADTGVLLRRNTKANLIGLPPVVGEMVFATDTGEHGWLNQSNALVWKVLNEAFPTIPADIVTAPAGVLPTLDGSNLTNLPIPVAIVDYEKSVLSSVGQAGPGNITLFITVDGPLSVTNFSVHEIEVEFEIISGINIGFKSPKFSVGFFSLVTGFSTLMPDLFTDNNSFVNSTAFENSIEMIFNFAKLARILGQDSVNQVGFDGGFKATVRFKRVSGTENGIGAIFSGTENDELYLGGGG